MEKQITQPMNIVLVRHGQSEFNEVADSEKHHKKHPNLRTVYARHDFEHPLTAKGVLQAKAARQMLIHIGMTPESFFDEWYVSPYVRTVETAAFIGDGKIDWLPELRLHERDWGLYGSTPLEQRRKRFADTERRRETSNFWTRLDNGENVPDNIGRVRDWIATLNRAKTNKNILAVAHGETMWSTRYVLEGLYPEQWSEMDKDKSLRIGNCCILAFSRQNPEDPTDISPTMPSGWRLMIDPFEPEKSPYGGEWQKMNGRTRLIGAEILAQAEMRNRMTAQDVLSINATIQ